MKENIIFDLGGVLIDLHLPHLYTSFDQYGQPGGMQRFFSLSQQNTLLDRFERGQVKPAEFREGVRQFLSATCSDEEFDNAWFSFVLDIPKEKLNFLQNLRKTHRVYLLSNTNHIHLPLIHAQMRRNHTLESLDVLFDRAYYSCDIGVRKPEREAFEFVLKDAGIDPTKSIFIDDVKANVEAAAPLGITPVHYQGEPLDNLLSQYLLDGKGSLR